MNSTFFAVAFMLFLAVIMFYGQIQYKKHKADWGKTLTIICGFIIIATAVWLNLFKSKVDNKAIEREKLYQNAQAMILANTLTNQYAGTGKCLVIHHPVDARNRKDVDRLILAFKDGFGGKLKDVKSVPIKEYDMSAEMPEEAMMENTAEDFNKILNQYTDYDLVIFMVPLPYSKEELMKINIFKMIPDAEDNTKFVRDPSQFYPLVGVYNGYIGNLEELFYDDLIGAMSLWKPDPTIDELAVPDNVMDAFSKRYLIITPQTIKGIKDSYPKLFPKKKEVKTDDAAKTD
ncbi:MAG: hypothetical protein NE330_06790 [Lentisphaeraceae bacterium]|nr:hypothetical protein [Lentisphaeraceae bacterium]